MDIRVSAHSTYHQEFHIVWIPKYRKKILKGELKQYIEVKIREVGENIPDIEIKQLGVQIDHVHMLIVIPPKYSTSSIVGKLKANTSRMVRNDHPWLKKIYWRPEFWSVGFFSSTVGVNEKVIERYIRFQEKVDKGQMQLSLDL